ncbi:TIGR01620 family protein [Nitratireductor sp. XY-223]|uniref:YcjF family protein n=1 Tax=Nitratireductor sp. XY-223 TaxID=2561926 RepID=UPI0010A9F170|nr:TIGR01620 family protein [Nitratireductor sp. XY-223]
MTKKQRKPAAFDIEESEDELLPLEFADPGGEALPVEMLTPPVAEPKRRGFSFGKLALGAFGLLFSMAFALWLDGLIAGFFARSVWLGWMATALTAIAVVSLVGIALREIRSLMRLDAVHSIREEAEKARQEKLPKHARSVQARLMRIFADRPETARARRQLKELDGEVIDGPHLMDLIETQLLGPVDQEARRLIVNASKRVSVVTALSPRALIDIGYVLFESMRLIRRLATLYGGRPGTLGAIRLARDVVGHLAVTGSMALGDGMIQQLMGQGLASKVSARLGEGVVNGLMTARIGIAAMDLCRPLAFHSLKRPGIGEFVGDLTRQAAGGKKEEKNKN